MTRQEAALGRAPLRLVLPAVLAVTFLAVPLLALLVRTPWSDLGVRLTDPAILDALRLSVLTSTAAVVLVTLVGVPLSWLLARAEFRGRSLVRALVIVPLVLPPVVGGVALLSAFGRRGVVGGPLYDAFGISLPFTTAAVVVAHAFVALPFFVLSVEGALRATNREYDVVAATLGASRWTTFLRVSLPLAGPGLLAGLVLSWARALGEFGATITFAGNYPGTTRTMPNAIYVALQSDPDAAIVLSVILMVVSVAVLALLRERWFDQAVQGARG
ncbi:ABC transporter permease [Nocardioides mesophilus]|uniref:Molybdenum transport system permease n=1 Tax=Nocardioides mesophilus TaxID=433659 RepID=A0A7G9R7U9_9ACTN|nr:ABC transporter permease [Nocardioides mesophilus]QNN51674.1 molybdate ABC transporter permease subunit [Nocardioides mesophilus]